METLFHALVWAHVVSGAIGLVVFWVPVLVRKGQHLHRRAGLLFCRTMIVTGTVAVAISTCTLVAPRETHPAMSDVILVRAVFGWLMLYLGVLTVSLAWHGLQAVRRKHRHEAHRAPFDIVIQLAVIAAGVQCARQGVIVGMPLLFGVGAIGCVSASVILKFILGGHRHKLDYLHMHVRASVGAGIAAYTAFLSVALVRSFPELTFHPALWAMPTLVGGAIVGLHEVRLFAARARASSGVETRAQR